MNILITNTELDQFAGTQTYAFAVSRALRRRGHGVALYSPRLGRVAAAMRREGFTVVDQLSAVPFQPEAIHGHHAWETTVAALKWPEAGVVSFCHGSQPWQEEPCRLPWVHRHIAVGEPCRERVSADGRIPASKIELLLNFVDMERFELQLVPRGGLRRLLVLSNHVKRGRGLEPIQEACDRYGLQCEVVGDASGNAVEDPREALAWADVVVAQGRSALEAMASGRAVILGGVGRIGPLVTPQNFDWLRPLNFGFTCLTEEMTPTALAARLAGVNPFDTAAVTDRVRAVAGLDEAIDRLERYYKAAWAAAVEAPPTPAMIAASACDALESATPAWKLGRSVQAIHAQRASETNASTPASTVETENWVRQCDRDAMRLANRISREAARPAGRDRDVPSPRSWQGRVRHVVTGLWSA